MSGINKNFPNTDHTAIASTSAGYIFTELNKKNALVITGRVYEVFFDADFSILINKLAPSRGDFRVLAETIGELLLVQNPLIRHMLTIVGYSPIDIEITSPNGKRIGTDITTGETINEIPDSRYSNVAGEHEYVIILDPLPGEYKIRTIGTGSGEYAIAVGYGGTTTSDTLLIGQTGVGEITNNTLTLSSTTEVTLSKDEPPLPIEITPDTCVADMQLAYENKWITKKSVYNALVADCKLLKVLFTARDKAKSNLKRKGILFTIKLTLEHMDKLAKDKSNKKEAVELITKNTTWFREHELD